MHAINNKTSQKTKVAEELMHLLADTYTLYLKTQNFHWNVTGQNFYSFHLLFEKHYQELALAVDEIAERIRGLGEIAPASYSEFQKLTSLSEQTQKINASEMVKKLLEDHETICQHINHVIPKAQQAEDEATVDLLIERLRSHEKSAWMLRSILE